MKIILIILLLLLLSCSTYPTKAINNQQFFNRLDNRTNSALSAGTLIELEVICNIERERPLVTIISPRNRKEKDAIPVWAHLISSTSILDGFKKGQRYKVKGTIVEDRPCYSAYFIYVQTYKKTEQKDQP